jgi:predicted TIM-barrel fold metal-dependent hydrolase
MQSRRELLAGAGIAAIAAFAGPVRDAFGSAAQPKTPVDFDVPANACDCHVHIIGDGRRFPYAASRVYTPETASVAELRTLHRTLHIDRVVVVQSTVYGADNACTLDAIKQIGPSARGIAVLSDATSSADLDEMHRGGIRGVRIHFEALKTFDAELVRKSFRAAAERIRGRKWHLEVVAADWREVEALREEVAASEAPVSFDLGVLTLSAVDPQGFKTLQGMLQGGKTYVNIAGPYNDLNYAPIAKPLIAANPERITWGSNWPHVARLPGRTVTEITPLAQVDDGRDLNRLPTWTANAAELKLILVENPARLYGF